MTQILLIERDDTLRKIIKLNLANVIGSDVVEKNSLKEAIELLRILPEMDLIIFRDNNEKAAEGLIQFLNYESLSIPLLVIGSKVSGYKSAFFVDAKSEWKAIVEKASLILKTGQDDAFITLPQYVPVGVYYFMNITTIMPGCDIYIRVKKTEKDYQYVKRLHAGDHFSKEDILKYHENGLNEFFIAKENFAQFVNFITDELVTKLADKTLSGIDRISVSSDAYRITQERILTLGVDEHTERLVHENVASMMTLLKEQNVLATFLKALKSKECSHAYAHSYLCCLVSHKILSKFDWQSQQIREKLAYIAYFHDIALNGSELTEINCNQDFEKIKLRDDERKKVEGHALESARIVGKFNNLPSGIDAIIKEHHGSRTGVGFVENYSSTLLPLSMMFIVTEHFVDELLKVNGNPNPNDMKNIFDKLQLKFNKSTYGQTLMALQDMVTSTKKSKDKNREEV